MEKFEEQETLNKINELQKAGELDDINYNIGQYEGSPMLVIESWEDLVCLKALLNGYTGNCDLAVLWGKYDIGQEMDKTVAELEKTRKDNPTHLGTISRLERYLKQLNNLSAYKRWVHDNEIEEKDFGIDVGFSDEYSPCCECYTNIVRTSPDSYSWTASLWVDACGYACEECVEKGIYDDYILEQYANEQKSIPESFDLDRLGLVKINEESYQNGFFHGMDESPKPIIKALHEENDIDVFFIVHPSQFYIDFDVYVKASDFDRAKKILEDTDTYQGYSTAGNLEKALKGISEESSKVSGEGIRYTKVDVSNGTSETRLVSKEEFIDGIKD